MNITGIVITLNEEKRIEACLNSLHEVCDELIVVDSFSTDRTVELAEKCGATVRQLTWEGYAATKNKANELAEFPTILSLDADEVLSKELIESIKGISLHEKTAFTMNRRNRFEGKWMYHTGWYPDKKLRIFPKDGAHWEGNFVHEELVLDTNIPVVHLFGDILHYSADDVESFYRRNEKYALLRVKEIISKGKKITFLKCLMSSVFEFIKRVIIQKGFLDGKRGIQLAWIHARLKMTRYHYYQAIQKGAMED